MLSLKKTFVHLSLAASLVCLGAPNTSMATDAGSDIDRLIQRAEQRRIAIAQRMESSTVFIFAETDTGISMGTGFVVAPNYIMSNGHVVAEGKSFYVVGKHFSPKEARLIEWIDNDIKDFALLKVNMPADLPVLSFNMTSNRTDRVSAWGFPYMVAQYDKNLDNLFEGVQNSMPPVVYTEGHVSAFLQAPNGRKSIVHTAAIAGGNSGGPLVNSRGEVIGINTWGAIEEDEGAFINASLPAADAVEFLRSCGIEPNIVQNSNTASTPFENNSPSASSGHSPQAPQKETNNPLASLGSIVSSGISAVGGSTPQVSSPSRTERNDEQVPSSRGLSGDALDIYDEAVAGDANAQAYLGLAHWQGDEAPENITAAITWLQRASTQNNADALCLLGLIYLTEADHHDPKNGMKLLAKSASIDADYASILSQFHFFGESYGVARNAQACLEAAQKGADVDDPEAIAMLAFLHFYGEDVVDIDKKLALKYAHKAEKGKAPLAYGVLSLLHISEDITPSSPEKAFSYAQKGAAEDDGLSKAVLAVCYYDGIGTEVNYEKALEYAQESSEEFQELGQLILANLYAQGFGVAKNLPYALAYYDMAARKNLTSAIENKEILEEQMSKKEIQAAQKYAQQFYAQKGLTY